MKENPYKRVYDEKWNFKEHSMKELVHGLHSYPAMMMPLIARTMFNEYGNGKETVFLDPYVGSGTTLVEAQFYGAKEAIGVDLNPLAILISKTKTEEINLKHTEDLINQFEKYINEVGETKPSEFAIRDSWFSKNSVSELAKIKHFVFNIDNDGCKDFFKIAFSEVVRAVSETRNSEFKLYRMPKKSLEKFNPKPIELFKEILKRNLDTLKNIDYKRETKISLYNENVLELSNHDELMNHFDLIITSPPYGDSHTTVAYGQFSRLSNEWFDIKDAGTLDRRLLGGKKTQDREFGITELDDAIKKIRINDKKFTRERCWEVISFYNDYQKSVEVVSKTVKSGGYVIYVVGNRRVRNVELPLDVITYKMFESYGFTHLITHVRDILNKRMPSKASPSDTPGGQISTMTQEYIVVMRKN